MALPAHSPAHTMPSTAPSANAYTGSDLPPLDPAIFNGELYLLILDFWYKGIPASTSVPERRQAQRWSGIFDDPSDKE